MPPAFYRLPPRAWIVPAMVFAIGLAITLAVAGWLRAQDQAQRGQRLDRWVERTQIEVLDALRRPGYGLGGARGAAAVVGGRLSPDGLARYVAARDLPGEFPGVLGFGVIHRVERGALDAYVAAARRADGDGFRVESSGHHPDLYVIRAVEPLARNQAARGFDIGSDPVRRAAVERVFRLGQRAITGPVRLRQAPGQAGALLLTPVFASGAAVADGSPVVAALYAPVVYPAMLSGLLPPDGAPIRFALYDAPAGQAPQQVYASHADAGVGPVRDVPFEFAGRRYLARYRALPAMNAGLHGIPYWGAFLGGLASSLLAALCVLLLTGSRARAVALAESMSRDLARLATVARLTRNAVVVTDPHGRIEWCNPAFEAISGYTLEQSLGRKPGELLQFEGTDQATIAALGDALRRRVPFQGQLLNRSAQGREYWIDIEVQPIVDARGALQGFIGVQSDITKAREQEQALRESEAFLDQTNRVAGVGGWEFDIASGGLVWSPETRRLHDVPDDFVPDVATAIAFYDEAARPVIAAAVQRALEDGTGWDLELQMVSYAGRRFWAHAVGEVVCEDGRPVRLVGAFQDITARKNAELALAHNTRLVETTLRSIGDAVLTTDTDGTVLWLNPAAERLTGWSHADARGRPAREILALQHEGGGEAVPCPIDACLGTRAELGPSADTVLVTRDGAQRFAIEASCSSILDDDGVLHGVVMVFNDVTEQRRMAREMSFRARHDALTGLVNRGELEVRLRESLARADEAPGALLFIDLDHFKVVNDSCGHNAGDHLLRQVAGLLSESVRRDDLVARFGGDEFAVLLQRCPLEKAQAIATAICEKVDAYRYVADDGRRFRVGASVGMVPVDARWASVSSLLQGVDEACYAAKHAGRGRVVVRDTGAPQDGAEHPSAWGARIEAALDNDGFELHAQRLVPIDGQPAGLHCEVLLRMVGADGAPIAPAAFMPSAERYQLASRIDRWVLRRVLGMLATRRLDGVEQVAVNLSGQSVGDSEFHRYARRAIVESGVRPGLLAFEITETAAITNLAQATAFIEDLRTLGVQVALDDFGSGTSSFAYLKQLQVDVLKIDGQFVKGLLDCPLDESAVRCFADVARVLGIATVAEHVEDADTCRRLGELGIGQAQGYHFHRPQPFAEVLDGHAAAQG